MQELGVKDETDYTFPDEHVLAASHNLIPWFTDFSNYLASDIVPLNLSFHQRKNSMQEVQKFFWDESYLYRSCDDGFIRRCMPKVEILSI